ncbi:adenomatous polyposis coli protein 2 isoform X2 [Xenopus tropicalis]|uniref:Adenomatous polyposis coli protein 2 n=1 Tax=Xenopus tropicalis TaxID=8364 RepID=A0A8J0SAM4_XENTR|nr:adenomatous polyposis coli protein 2 isoform X2 [Xenopus tropicalis]|eukprot:XP_012810058.1 PREDICTED: adenomatous polyposis coli protein 2 isoform X2 [Xenopus tropicalis]
MEVCARVGMVGAAASYDQLVRQVEDLKKENSHLRRELKDNSSQLNRLEHDTSDMKEVLKHLQVKLEHDVGGGAGHAEMLDQFKDISATPMQLEIPQKRARDESRTSELLMQELEKERSLLLGEIDKEEKEKLWYYSQIQSLSKRLEELPHAETFSLQIDLIRQQLEFESDHLHCVLEERFGTADEMVQRAQIRASHLEQIEQQLEEMQSKEVKEHQVIEEKSMDLAEKINTEAVAPPDDSSGQQESKVEVVFWLLSMLANRDKDDMSRTLLAMSSSQDSCQAMRRSGCLPLLIQILHEAERDTKAPESSAFKDARMRANAALHNVIFSQPDEGQAKKEMRVLHILEQIRSYTETCCDWMLEHERVGNMHECNPVPVEPQICQASCAIMKLSFDEEYRRAMNELGGLQAIAELLEVDYLMNRMTSDPLSLALRRYAGMALTNLTFGDVVNKATLCSRRGCMQAIVAHLASENEELQQVASSILRNLSWRADINSKKILREVGSVISLMQCALRANKESTLKSVLSALWNLSAHSTENKASVCSVEGSLGFLVSTLTYKCQSNSLSIIESGGGILRNVSSLIATRDDYRQILRDHNCLQTLLQHLRSHSLTIVSNACGTLWNLSARCAQDQELLWDLGAISMLRNLIHSKHKMIAMGSAAALRNLLAHRPVKYKDASVISPGSCMPSLYMRKQKALEAELDAKHLAETIDKQGLKSQPVKGPLRHIESLVKDYASDSGCFDDDDIPNTSISAETGNSSVLSMYLNSSYTQGQNIPRTGSLKRAGELEKVDSCKNEIRKPHEYISSADKLPTKIPSAISKIDRLVEDVSTMHTSSDDSFSLSSEDHCIDWPCGSDELHEARAHSCSPCRLSDKSGLLRRDNISRAQALLRLKTAYTSLSNDSLNSGSTSDGYCPKEHMKPCSRSSLIDYKDELQRYQKRPSRLDLKSVLVPKPERNDSAIKKVPSTEDQRQLYDSTSKSVSLTSLKNKEGTEDHFVKSTSNTLPADPLVHTIKLSPSYKHITGLDSVSSNVSGFPGSVLQQKKSWLLTSQIPDSYIKTFEKASNHSSTEQESLQKYAVEGTPICFSRCSSLSSLSSGDNILDGQSRSDNDIDSDSSLEILEMEEGNIKYKSNETEDAAVKQGIVSSVTSQPMVIPMPKPEKHFFREVSPSRNDDMTPSSSSENYIQETPLVMSRCSSVSSLGSFESPSIASSIQSDPCSEMISGTISPSELPDSPGQTMPPSRSKTPSFETSGHLERETSQFNIQWENNVKKFMEITDFKERFQIPRDIDSMIYFTVEKPTENFSCASSLSALPLHEHYIEKDVELKLIPPFSDKNCLNFVAHEKRGENREERILGMMTKSELELVSDDDIDILKECINSAMPSRLRNVKTSVLSTHILNSSSKKPVHLPVYMLVPAHTQLAGPKVFHSKQDLLKDDSSYTDSAEGTPVNFSSAASLSDETLQYPLKDDQDLKDRLKSQKEKREFGTMLDSNLEKKRRSIYTMENIADNEEMRKNFYCANPTKYSNKGNRPTSPAYPLKAHQTTTIGGPEHGTVKYDARTFVSPGHPSKLDLNQGEYVHGNLAFQSFCHTTPTEEAVYCFYEEDRDTLYSNKNSPKIKQEPTKSPRKSLYTGVSKRGTNGLPASKSSNYASTFSNLIEDEPIPCYSLSSSMSSLSDIEPICALEKVDKSRRHSARLQCRSLNIHAGSRDSSVSRTSDEERCTSSVLPRRKRTSARKRKHTLKLTQSKSEQNPVGDRSPDGGEMSDLDSIDWEAIKEGANSIVSWIHQAASSISRSTSSMSRGPSSDSLMSSPSVSGHQPLQGKHKQSREWALRPRVQNSNKANTINSNEETKNVRERKVNSNQKQASNIPMVLRGRTVIYVPAKEKESSTKLLQNQAPHIKDPTKVATAVRSRSLHRLGKSSDLGVEMTLPKRSATPPARISNASSSSSSRNSTPSRKAQAPVPSPISKRSKNTQVLPGNKTQKSPVRIPFMKKPTPRCPPGPSPLAIEPVSPLQSPSRRPQGSRLNQVKNSESEKSGMLRQLTFIKESSGSMRRQHSDLSVSRQHRIPPPKNSALPAVFLCSSRCEELKVHKQPKPKVTASPNCPPRRTSSESPSRLPVRNLPPAPEPFKRYSSSPHINLPGPRGECRKDQNASRAEEARVSRPHTALSQDRATWRRIRDEDIPHILRSTLPACALPLTDDVSEPRRKTSDAVVQTEDIAVTKTNSSTSPTLESSSMGSRNRPGLASSLLPELGKSALAVVNLPTSRHSSPSRAARVTPFNYVPSPILTVTEEAAGKVVNEEVNEVN